MKIYDITQELFSCAVYPGDPAPQKETMLSIGNGDICNLTAFKMCAHNGTHVDAPYHFINDGKTIDQITLDHFVGPAFVIEHNGVVTAEDAKKIMSSAKALGDDCDRRILLKGNAEVSLEAAKIFVEEHILLIGNESQTVGPENAPAQVHLCLLPAEIVLLEGIRLAKVPEGKYILNAAPINLGGCDGSPCRAILMKM